MTLRASLNPRVIDRDCRVTHVADESRSWLGRSVAGSELDLTYCIDVPAALRVRPKRTMRWGPNRVLKFSEMRPLYGLQTQTSMRTTHRRRRTEETHVTKITGYQNRPVQAGTDKKVSRNTDASTESSAGATSSGSSPIQITDQARQLAALEHALQALPVVDDARVSEIRSAIENGSYEVAPERIADKLLSIEKDLGGLES
jgi:negative regulator of flagellin synthesis FlgM